MTNRMLYSRGSRHDFTTWAKDKENKWDYKNILPYFLKLEDMLIEEQKISGTPGPCMLCLPSVVKPRLTGVRLSGCHFNVRYLKISFKQFYI